MTKLGNILKNGNNNYKMTNSLTQIFAKLLFFFVFAYLCFSCGQKKIESKVVDNQGDTEKIPLKDILQEINNEVNRELGFDHIESLEDTLNKYRHEKEIKILNCMKNVGCYFEIRIGGFLKNGKKMLLLSLRKPINYLFTI
jgi:hypothetical protein